MVLKELIEIVSLEELTSAINRLYDVMWHKIDVKQICDDLNSGLIYFDDFSEEELEEWLEDSIIPIRRNPNRKDQIGALFCSHREPIALIYNRIVLDDDILIPDEEILAHIIFAYNLNSESLFETLAKREEPYFSKEYVRNKLSLLKMLDLARRLLGENNWISKRKIKILEDDKIPLEHKKKLYEFYNDIDIILSTWENLKTNTDLRFTKKEFYNFSKNGIKVIEYNSINIPTQNHSDYLINLIRNYEDRDFKSDYSDSIVIIWIGNKCNVGKTEIRLLIPIIKNMFPNPIIGIGNEKGKLLRIEVLLKK